jgi:hypothetical protein
VLSGGAVARITSSKLKELVITDSIQPTEAVRVARNIRTLSIASLIGEAIARTASEESVSSLFEGDARVHLGRIVVPALEEVVGGQLRKTVKSVRHPFAAGHINRVQNIRSLDVVPHGEPRHWTQPVVQEQG